MPLVETAEHALLSVDYKEHIARFAGGLVRLGWEVHSYGGTRDEIEKAGIPVSGVEMFVGDVDLEDRDRLSTLLATYIESTPEKLATTESPAVGLVHMIPRPAKAYAYDRGYVDIMESAVRSGKIVVAKSRRVDDVLGWLEAGQPEEHEWNLEALAKEATEEIACYLGASS